MEAKLRPYIEVNVQFHTPSTLLQRKPTQVSITKMAGWIPERSGHHGEENCLVHMAGTEPRLLRRQAHSLVAIPTELFQLPSPNLYW
jgi:hypothetical protein